MNDIATLSGMLVAIIPAVSSIITILGVGICVIGKIKKALKVKDDELAEKDAKLKKAYDDIAICKAKLVSIEKHMKEGKE